MSSSDDAEPRSDRKSLLIVLAVLGGGFAVLAGLIGVVVHLGARALDAPPDRAPEVAEVAVEKPPPVEPRKPPDLLGKAEPTAPPSVPPPKLVPPIPPKPATPRGKLTVPPVAPVEWRPAPLDVARRKLDLPGTATDTCFGGGGRYWLFGCPREKRIAVFDVNAGAILKSIPLADENFRFAAGMNKLVVAYPATGVAVRYDLGTLEKEATKKLPFEGIVQQAAMGSASAGPLLIQYVSGVGHFDIGSMALLDLETFQELDAGPEGVRMGIGGPSSVREPMQFRFTPDGRTLASWTSQGIGSLANSSTIAESGVKGHRTNNTDFRGIAVAADGTLFTEQGLFTSSLVAAEKGQHRFDIPARSGRWYLTGARTDAPGPPAGEERFIERRLHLRLTGEPRPIATVDDGITVPFPTVIGLARALTMDQRVLFHPDANVLGALSATNDAIVLHRLDLDQTLRLSGFRGPIVDTSPPAAVPGRPFRYPVGIRSATPVATLTLDSGPDGMKLNGRVLEWNVPGNWDGTATVSLTARDSAGGESVHRFRLSPTGQREVLPALAEAAYFHPVPEPIPIAPTRAGNNTERKLPGPADAACLAGGGRYVLLRLPRSREVAIHDVSAGEIVKRLPLPEAGSLVAGSAHHAYILSPQANTIQRWNLARFEKEAEAANPLGGRPTGLLTGHDADGPLLVTGPNGFVDGHSLKSLPRPGGIHLDTVNATVRVSADGRVWAWTRTDPAFGGTYTLVLGERSGRAHWADAPLASFCLAPDGNLLGHGGSLAPDLRYGVAPAADRGEFPMIPAAHGPAYLKIERGRTGAPNASLMGTATLGTFAGFSPGRDSTLPPGSLPFHDRVFLVPDANAMVVLNPEMDTLHLHTVNVGAALEKAGIVVRRFRNRPPEIVPGQEFRYTPEVTGIGGRMRVSLSHGPFGMSSQSGTIVWKVPENHPGFDADFTLKVTDDNQRTTEHRFQVPVTGR